MTRKHAALKAIELLSGNEENREICEALEKIAHSKLTLYWDKELVLEALEDFIREHGYFPGLREMDRDDMMPKHSSFTMAMGMNYTNVKEKYFPDAPTKEDVERIPPEEWMENFKKVYLSMGMPTEKEYNDRRTRYMLHSSTWIKKTESASWEDLLRKCGLKEYIRKNHNRHCSLTVSTSESDLPATDYDRMEEDLKKLLA